MLVIKVFISVVTLAIPEAPLRSVSDEDGTLVENGSVSSWVDGVSSWVDVVVASCVDGTVSP